MTKLWLELRYNGHTTTKRTKINGIIKPVEFSLTNENEELRVGG
jgi:hypothetical protein